MITMKITCSYLEVVSPAGRGKHKIRSHMFQALRSIAIKKLLSFV